MHACITLVVYYFIHIYPQCEIHALQSAGVTVLNAANTAVSVSMTSHALSCAFNTDFTFENVSSIGLKFGLYGVRKWMSAPVLYIRSITSST